MNWEDYEDDAHSEFMSNRMYLSEKKRHAPAGVHIMNKNEFRLMRKLMSETGLSEKEIRAHKKYRKMLSEAQKVPAATKGKLQKAKNKVMKQVTRDLKLAKEHPAVVEEFNKRWNEFYKKNQYILQYLKWL